MRTRGTCGLTVGLIRRSDVLSVILRDRPYKLPNVHAMRSGYPARIPVERSDGRSYTTRGHSELSERTGERSYRSTELTGIRSSVRTPDPSVRSISHLCRHSARTIIRATRPIRKYSRESVLASRAVRRPDIHCECSHGGSHGRPTFPTVRSLRAHVHSGRTLRTYVRNRRRRLTFGLPRSAFRPYILTSKRAHRQNYQAAVRARRPILRSPIPYVLASVAVDSIYRTIGLPSIRTNERSTHSNVHAPIQDVRTSDHTHARAFGRAQERRTRTNDRTARPEARTDTRTNSPDGSNAQAVARSYLTMNGSEAL